MAVPPCVLEGIQTDGQPWGRDNAGSAGTIAMSSSAQELVMPSVAIPCLRYRDTPAAIDWLCEVLDWLEPIATLTALTPSAR